MPHSALINALERHTDGQVLDGLARLLPQDIEGTQKILLNRHTADETVEWITSQTNDEKIIEIIAANEERLLRCPRIIEALYCNRATRMSTADRAVELAVRHGIELEGILCFSEIKAAIQGQPIPKPTAEPTADDILFKNNMEFEEWQELDDLQIDEALSAELKGDDKDQTQKKVATLEQLLQHMNPAQKIRMATLGNSQQRSLLIRDSNKLVIMSCIKSPAISESEVRRYSTFRSLPEDVLRYIGKKREWTRHYQVKFNLVLNPRCPIDISMGFLPHLRPVDAKAVERDKNVPGAIAAAAKRLRQKRL
jgi:hypothetical protein